MLATRLLTWIAILPAACLFGYRGPSDHFINCGALKEVFDGFTLVSQSSCDAAEYRPHAMTALPQPSAYKAGICYVYIVPNSSEEPVYKTIERSLRKGGAKISHSPERNHDEIQLMMGGPLFQIDFRVANHEATINAVQDPSIAGNQSLRQSWRMEDFVLRFSR